MAEQITIVGETIASAPPPARSRAMGDVAWQVLGWLILSLAIGSQVMMVVM